MAGALQRATFNRAGLVRILSETVPHANAVHYDFGERLGQWLDFTDALALFSVLNAGTGSAAPAPMHPRAHALQAHLARTRQHLAQSIAHDGVFTSEPAKLRFPTPLPEATPESAADFSPYHRFYLAHQRDMHSAIAALRTQARKALSNLDPAHRQLAELDAAFEKTLFSRERHLLSLIPMLLAKRFAERLAAHRAQLLPGDIDDPARWTEPDSWLAAFCQDTQAVLLAELDLRLKPVAGLIAALGKTADTPEDPPHEP
jgi:hypothetical protein